MSGGLESLHSLRFSARTWESSVIARAGLYTNRVRFSDLVGRIERAGFSLETVEKHCWDRLPVSREALASPFQSLPDDELLVRDLFVAARPA